MSNFPIARLRRLRGTEGIRKLVRSTYLQLDDLVYPLFIIDGKNIRNEVSSMPGVFQISLDNLLTEAQELVDLGINSVILFGVPENKDPFATEAYNSQGSLQQAVNLLKQKFPQLTVITDVCLCEYTSHGHCGIVENDRILNDPTLEILSKIAVSHAQAGADIVAPSDMMDGRVAAIRMGLDQAGFLDLPIMSYSAKYASSFYGPFRDAAGSTPQFGDRRSYQMDPASSLGQAVDETALDVAEGADIVMVKPALAYLDVIRTIKDSFNCPVAAYNVSGEYAMVKAAAQKGWVNEGAIVKEIMTSLKRAGTDIIITYFAKDIALRIKNNQW